MDTILIMCLGIFIGKFISSKKFKKMNELMSLSSTFLLIFAMGVMLGKKDDFLQELVSLGIYSFVYFLIPTLLSIIVVYSLTKYFMDKKENKEKQR